MKKSMVISGFLLMIIAIIIAFVLVIPAALSFKNPATDNIAEISSGDEVLLEKGTYNIWSEKKPKDLTIVDSSGKEIDVEEIRYNGNYPGIQLYYKFEIDEEGNYTFTYKGDKNIMITDNYTDSTFMYLLPFGCCCGGVLFLIGLILIITGFVIKKNRR
jgi:hypothetical protein